MKKFRIAIFASGSGTNAEKVIRHFRHHPFIDVAVLLSNNPQAYVLERAKLLGIPTIAFTRDEYDSQKLLNVLQEKKVTHLVLAGFLWLVPDYLIKAFHDRIINIHPALLPKFGGKGMYGIKVHRAVRESSEKETGITIHLVNERYDEGKILFQIACPVTEDQTAENIAACVHQLEYEHYPRVIEKWILARDH